MPNGCRTEGSEMFLSEDLIARASMRGDEYAWRKKDLLRVADEAQTSEIACDGWKVLFRTPDGDGELCWFSFYPEGLNGHETWQQFVERSWQVSRGKWRELFKEAELLEEGRKAFRLIQQTEDKELLPREALWFIIYFRSSESGLAERKPARKREAPGDITEEWEMGLCQEGSRSGPRMNGPGKNF